MSDPGLDLEIKQLERDKKIEEIRQLKASSRTKWITPAALAALLPLLAGFGVWAVNEMKQYGEGYRALADKARLEREAVALQQQKAALNQEIVALLALKTHYADEFRALEEKVKARQAQIDTAHLRARFSSGEARYALSHVDAVKSDPAKLRMFVAQLPAGVSTQMSEFVRDYELALDMIKVTKDTLAHTDAALKLIPASDWTAKLNSMPSGAVITGRKIMVSAEDPNRLYDVDEARFLTREEADRLGARR